MYSGVAQLTRNRGIAMVRCDDEGGVITKVSCNAMGIEIVAKINKGEYNMDELCRLRDAMRFLEEFLRVGH